ncbi:Membrane-associated phospholipid phosphatase [Lysobacter dokdonensis DS-58]|uniref:undecaprenyl-diphosphate phosphatase n=1 Tax=Lysobacter dokdonensis DS-58 TaxID=1300345 RepID=A0A0A2WHN3_9GAMM|nr:phosphatase PAP2 family protein [Lysobacter dokdonensis]KGQ19323.1 Membrane-associated phospholipid phosphatase [Lysobacter dokdonensis DS-58]
MIRRRFAWVCVAAAVVLSQVTEEVLGNESTRVDREILVAIHDSVSSAWRAVFDVVTLSASARVLLPAVALLAMALAIARHRQEALLLALSAGGASMVVYVAKTAFGRARPDLWDTQWYWGSSFPSGHTLSAAAVATAACLVVARLRPAWARASVLLAIAWVALVALSRLVLGVHWPTDVVAAACAGLLVAAGVSGALSIIERRTQP